MITSWTVYWITRLDNFAGLFACLAAFFGFAFFFFGILIIAETRWEDESWPKTKRVGQVMIGIIIVSLLWLVIVPSTKEAVAIYMIPKIANNEQIQKLPDNAAKFLNQKLKEWIKDMTQQKVEG